MGEWRISIHDAKGVRIDALDIIAASWPAALQRSAQFFVTSKAMLSFRPAVEVRLRRLDPDPDTVA